MIDFSGQAVIVTGAGRGLGRLYALELARRGASVVVNDLGGAARGGNGGDEGVAASVVEEIRGAGGTAVASTVSVASPAGGQEIVDAALDSFGRLDAVISNAGILNIKPFDELDPAAWREMLAVHLDGAFYLAQPAFRAMKARGYGRFVFTSSSAGVFGVEHYAHYASAKTGLLGLRNVIALEGAAHNILANAVLPWGTTRMLVEESAAPREEILQMPLMRVLDAKLVVPMTTYLASAACDVTHQDFSAAAGRYARVFTALGEGWLAPDGAEPTAEEIAANMPAITATDEFRVPMSVRDETLEICERRGLGTEWLV